MLFAGDASEWLLPMPVTLVAVMLVFSLWRRILPRQRRLRRSVAVVVVVAFVLTSTPAIINIGVKALEGTPQTVAEQLDALGFPPDSGADALNAQAVLTVREGRAGRKALAEGGQVDPSSHGKVADRGRMDSSSRREAEDFVKTVAAPGGDATAASPAGAVKPRRDRAFQWCRGTQWAAGAAGSGRLHAAACRHRDLAAHGWVAGADGRAG